MGGAGFTFVTATLLATCFLFDNVVGRTQGTSDGSLNDSFDDRMQLYTQWAQNTHGRRLAHSPTESPTIVVQPKGKGAPAPKSLIGSGECKVLRYHTGYANTTLYFDKIIKDSPNFGECCKSCKADPQCLAWTRVAGGDPANFRNCYLKYNIDALDELPGRYLFNHEGHAGDSLNYPELRYANQDLPIILESGTIPDLYPADYYGCPYSPGNAALPCDAPPGCNVDGNGVFVAPPCIE